MVFAFELMITNGSDKYSIEETLRLFRLMIVL